MTNRALLQPFLIGVIALSSLAASLGIVQAQTNSQTTLQTLMFERPEQIGTYIRLEPPAAVLTPFAIQLPADTPRAGAGLYISGTSPHTSEWTYHSGAVIELATSNGNLRRMGLSLAPGSASAVPGNWSMDLQAYRTNSTQTSAGSYSLVFSGSENTATGTYASVAGGSQNTATAPQDVIFGGSNNSVSSFGNANGRSGILGGEGNFASGYEVVLFGGRYNYLQANVNNNRAVIGGGELDSVTGLESTILGGFNNNAFATNSTVLGGSLGSVTASEGSVLGGLSNHVSGSGSVVFGGQSGGVKSINSFLFNGGPTAISVNTAGEFFLNNVDIVLAGSGGGQSELRLYEPRNSATIGVVAGFNYVAFRGPQETTDNLDNTYSLPAGIPTTGTNVMALTNGETSTTGEMQWMRTPSQTIGTHTANAANTTIAAALLNDGEVVFVNSNGIPNARNVALSNGQTNGFVVTLRVYNATVANGIRLAEAANLNLRGTANADLNQYDTITFVWDATSAVWLEVARSTN